MKNSNQELFRFIRSLYNEPSLPIPLHAPLFSGNEKKYLLDCIDSTFVSSVGAYVDKFEQKIAEYTGSKKAVACVNGTSALHLALRLVGVSQNTEVITQPLTFIATVNAISYCSANPVFLDVDQQTLGLSPDAMRNWIHSSTEKQLDKYSGKHITINKSTGRRISACIPMHTFGFPCRIDEIVEICTENNIPVVEDAAESLGSYFKEQHTGTFGKVGILSFNGNKIITSGGGGMLLFQDTELAEKAKHLSTQAKISHPWDFEHDEIGYNYRMPNINAALGLAQLELLPSLLDSKRDIAKSYEDFFSTQNMDITFITSPSFSKPNNWLNSILLKSKEERDHFLKQSNNNGIMTRPLWRLMNKLRMFDKFETDSLENSRSLESKLVNLPSSAIMQ